MLDQKKTYIQQYESSIQSRTRPGWLASLRERAISEFETADFPTQRSEAWKKTNVAPILGSEYLHPDPPSSTSTGEFEQISPSSILNAANRIVFVNAHYNPTLSSLSELPEGIIVSSLSEARNDVLALFEPHVGQLADDRESIFTAWNTAFLSDASLIYVPRGVIVKEPIHLIHWAKPNGNPTISHPRVFVLADENSSVSIVESYWGSGNYFTNAVSEIIAKENAMLNHYKLQKESYSGFHISTVCYNQGRSSQITSYSISLGGKLVRNDLNIFLNHEGAHCILNGLYIADDHQHVDHHTLIDHAKPHCTSREFYKGILTDQAKAVFDGKIIVQAGAQKTNAGQTNRNLVLSDEATVDTNPRLEIFADDVKCTHGATIGRLDETALFYLRSRGMSLQKATYLLTNAFVTDVLLGVENKKIRGLLRNLVSEKILSMQR